MTRLVTRRELINLLGATGGTAAVLQAGSVLGLLPATASAAAYWFYSHSSLKACR